jgi:serine/threonine protein kinase
MWSFGCILTELFTGYPLFPGENEAEQLACVMEIFGVPTPDVLAQSTRKKHFFDSHGNPRIISNSKGKKKRPSTKSLINTVPTNDAAFLDFIRKCLNWNPKERMSAEEGLKHPWITSLFNKLSHSEVQSRGGNVAMNLKSSLDNLSRYSSSIGPIGHGILPEVNGFNMSNKNYSMPNLKAVSYISPSNSNLHKSSHPVSKRTFKTSNVSGLPPITLSNQSISKSKYIAIDRKNASGKYTKDAPVNYYS